MANLVERNLNGDGKGSNNPSLRSIVVPHPPPRPLMYWLGYSSATMPAGLRNMFAGRSGIRFNRSRLSLGLAGLFIPDVARLGPQVELFPRVFCQGIQTLHEAQSPLFNGTFSHILNGMFEIH